MSPFEIAKSIDRKKYCDDITGYCPFIINKKMSLSADTFMAASEMNRHHGLDNRLQYDYYYYSIRPNCRRPFVKWIGKHKNEDLQDVMEYFGYNRQKAKHALRILSSTQLETIKKELLIKGGGT